MVKNIPTIERSTKIRFGKYANDNQAENTIVFNASNTAISASTPGSVYMTPLRQASIGGATFVGYDATTKEVVDTGVASSLLGGISLDDTVKEGPVVSNGIPHFANTLTAFTTRYGSNVGIANTSPIHALDVGEKLYITRHGNVHTSGKITAGKFYGDGSTLSNMEVGLNDVILHSNTASSKTVEFNYANGPSLITANTVGISNANPIHTLDVGSNLYAEDTAVDVLNVTGNVNVSNYVKTTNVVASNISLTSITHGDLLVGPSSGTVLEKLAAYVPTAGSTAPANMTANSSGGNTASSSNSSADTWKAFDGSDSTNYVSLSPSTYSYSYPYGHTGSNSLGGVNGEWVKIQLSSAITPTSVFVKARPDNSSPDWAARPNSWRILGSNDDSTWTQLHSSTTLVDDTNGTTESFTNTTAYSYLAIVVTNINNPGMGDARWTLSRLSFTQPASVSEKFLKSSAAGVSWDEVSSTLQAITDGGASTTNEVSFTNGVTSLTASSNVVVTGNVTTDTVYTGNVYAGNVATTDKVTAGTFHGDGSSITHLNLGDANNTGQVAIARGGTGVTTGLTALDPANLSSQVLLAKGGTGLTAVSENDLLLGPASGTALTKLAAYVQTAGSTVPAAMSANSSGGNTASSSDSSSDAYKAFDGGDTDFYVSANNYDWQSPWDYQGSNSLGSVLGEWIKIQLSSAITPTSVFLKAKPTNNVNLANRPQQWRIMGSNDNSMWTQLHASTTLVDDTNGTTESFTNTTAYSYLAIVVTHINYSGMTQTKWTLSRLSFTSSPSGPTEKFLKSSAAGIAWDEVSSSLQTITDGGASTTNEVSFTNGVTSLTASGNVVVTGNVTASNIISTNLTSGKIPYTDANKELIDSKVSFNTTTNVTSVASNLVVTGNLTVQGGTTFQDSNIHTVSDPIIEIGNANAIDNLDMGIIMTRPTVNVVAGFRGFDGLNEYTIAYTKSDPDGPRIIPTNTEGYITANVWGNVVAGNVTSTGKVTASTFHGDGSSITHLNLGDANNTGQVAIARGGTGVTTGLTALNATNLTTGTVAIALGGTGVTTGLTALDPANLSSQVLLTKGGTGLTSVAENELLLGPASGTTLSTLSPHTAAGKKFLRSDATGIAWDDVSSNLESIVSNGPATANITSNTIQFTNTVNSLTASGNVVVSGNVISTGVITLESSAGSRQPLKVVNAINVDPSYASPSHNVLSINRTTGEIYDSGGQGGSTYNNLHEEGANVSIGPSASANLTVNTYGSNVLTVSGNVSADNITIGALHVSASPFNFDDVVSTSAGANVTSNVITVGGLVTSGNVEAGNVIITDNITVTGNATSQNIKLTNTEISATISSGTITIDAKEKSYGTAPLVTSTDDVSNLIFSNFISGSQIVVPILASGGNIKISKELTNVNFYAMTTDVSVSQDKHALMTLSNVSGNIYMNALAFA